MSLGTPRSFPARVLAAGLGLAAVPALAAAPPAAPAAAAKPADNQVEHAVTYLRVLIGALQSESVDAQVKDELVGCLYNNSLGKITESMDRLGAENPGKIHLDNPNEVLSGMVALCGHRTTPPPATNTQPTGR